MRTESLAPMSNALTSLMVLCFATGLTPPLEPLGQFDPQRIPESSGIVKSRRYPGIYWVHNDSGNPPLLFAVRADGQIVRQFRLEVPNIDWEDITIDDAGHLYLGDIGNNTHALPIRVIYRFDEPDPAVPRDKPLAVSSATFYALPSANRFDAESLIVDRGSATLVAKYHDGREAELFSVPLVPPSPMIRPARPRSIGRLPGFTEPATGAALSEDRTLLAVCSETVVRIYQPSDTTPWRLLAEVRYDPVPVEGIAWDGRNLVLVAEGRGLFRLSQAAWRAAAERRTSQGNKPVEAK
jgi:hypothetical protein